MLSLDEVAALFWGLYASELKWILLFRPAVEIALESAGVYLVDEGMTVDLHYFAYYLGGFGSGYLFFGTV